MSLSPNPQVKITHFTPRKICDDILAGAIDLAKKTGFSTHPSVITMLWSGLLLSAKNDLDEYDLLTGVQQQFVHSLSAIYGYGANDTEKKDDLICSMHTFYDSIADDFADIKSERNVFEFMSLVANVNAKFSPGNDASIVTGAQFFRTTASLISSHIYHILHGIDNPVILQFPDARIANSAPAAKAPTPARESKPAATQPRQPMPQPAPVYHSAQDLLPRRSDINAEHYSASNPKTEKDLPDSHRSQTIIAVLSGLFTLTSTGRIAESIQSTDAALPLGLLSFLINALFASSIPILWGVFCENRTLKTIKTVCVINSIAIFVLPVVIKEYAPQVLLPAIGGLGAVCFYFMNKHALFLLDRRVNFINRPTAIMITISAIVLLSLFAAICFHTAVNYYS